MLQEEGKYIFFSSKITYVSGGLDDHIAILEDTIAKALSLKRIPIIGQVRTPFQHRISQHSIPSHWDRYFDLAQTKITKIIPDGAIEEIKSTLRWVYEEDFNFKSYARQQIRHINEIQIYEPENEHYPVLYVTETIRSKLKKSGRKSLAENIKLFKQRHSLYKKYHIALSPSSEVNKLTDIVLHQFGTNRQNCRYIQMLFNSKLRLKVRDFFAKYYICMHLRANDQLLHQKKLYFAVQKEQISYIIETVAKKHKKYTPIYIMSDAEPSYFDFLKPKYNIYTYQDFPELNKLFSSEDKSADNNLLYMIEKNIMRHALVKILPPDRNLLMFEGDASYGIPPNIELSFEESKVMRRNTFRIMSFMHKIDKVFALLRILKEKIKIP